MTFIKVIIFPCLWECVELTGPGRLSIKRSLLAESRYPVQAQQWQQPYPCLAFMSSANHVAAQPLAAWQDSPDWKLTGLSLGAGSAQQSLVRAGEVCCLQLTRHWTNLRISWFSRRFRVRYPAWRRIDGDRISGRLKESWGSSDSGVTSCRGLRRGHVWSSILTWACKLSA